MEVSVSPPTAPVVSLPLSGPSRASVVVDDPVGRRGSVRVGEVTPVHLRVDSRPFAPTGLRTGPIGGVGSDPGPRGLRTYESEGTPECQSKNRSINISCPASRSTSFAACLYPSASTSTLSALWAST